MYFPISYSFPRSIIEGNRVTIPHDVMKANGWNVGTEIIVTFEPKQKEIKGIVI